ncbi:DUF1772 domain-containing protein [Nocardia miyunensis]|uniref:DUF1772 domain-containing protein n=1 Tax=Nocardia miyunensis TaxID=282684 RepID=UPI00082B8861|nr:DUF1772 domain-containing protein [Nocardia miyunensis]
MLSTTAQVLATIAVLGNGVVYGTDVLAGMVMRSVYRQLDDETMTVSAGWGHYFADRRMPFVGATGMIATVLTLVFAAVAGRAGGAIAAATALVALLIWGGIYLRIAKPINTAQTAAARTGVIPDNARALQDSWDAVAGYRIALQGIVIAALCAAIALL